MRLPCVPFGVKTGRPGTKTFWNTSFRQALAACFQQLTLGMAPILLRHPFGLGEASDRRQTDRSIATPAKVQSVEKIGDEESSRR